MRIRIANSNILEVPTDLIVLKYADTFYGAERIIAEKLGFNAHIASGEERFFKGGALPEVLFLGVGPLAAFRYERIEKFGKRVVRSVAKYRQEVRCLALTIHGPGYGLDPEQAFLSMISGLVAEWKAVDNQIEDVVISEISQKRCELLYEVLKERAPEFGAVWDGRTNSAVFDQKVLVASTQEFGASVEEKPRLFVAMPFSDDFQDIFEFGFHEAAKRNAFVCERLDVLNFTGDIVSEIKKRIKASVGVIALVDGHNPNVFLEIGFAWAHGKPTILVAKKDEVTLPFDISGQRCIFYRNLVNLRDLLSTEIAALKNNGVLVHNR
jgi:hypothetical protein